jgi:hypothetical protein
MRIHIPLRIRFGFESLRGFPSAVAVAIQVTKSVAPRPVALRNCSALRTHFVPLCFGLVFFGLGFSKTIGSKEIPSMFVL